jgi:hypothetical protein
MTTCSTEPGPSRSMTGFKVLWPIIVAPTQLRFAR